MNTFFFRHKYLILLSIITLLSGFLRFYNFDNSWQLGADQARDVLVAREALRLHTLPLIGPFSASGPFVFGPYWYWFYMIPIGIFSSFLLAPWILQSLLYTFMVIPMYFIGKKLENEKLGLLAAFFTAISQAEISLSINLVQSSLVGIISVGVFYFFINYIMTKGWKSLIAFSLLVGIAINTHFEAVPLMWLLPLAVIFGEKKLSHILILVISFLFPFIPLLIFDFHAHFYEASHIVHYLLARQSTTAMPKTWYRALVVSWPNRWGNAIGGYPIVGGILMVLFVLVSIYSYGKKLISKEIFALTCNLVLILITLRYFLGVIYINFIAFAFPLLLILTAWICYRIFCVNKYVGVLVFVGLVVTSVFGLKDSILKIQNGTVDTTRVLEKALVQKFPGKSFSIYDNGGNNKAVSLSLSLVLSVEGKSSNNGVKIGVAKVGAPINRLPISDFLGERLYDLGDISFQQLDKEGFVPVTQSSVYQSVENWYKE